MRRMQAQTSVAVSAADEVAAALYQASATEAAYKKWAGRELRALRDAIEELRLQVHLGEADGLALAGLRAELAAEQARFIEELKAQDPAYSTEIETLRAAVEDIAATPEGLRALALFNDGDEVGALAILDDLRAAHDRARAARVAFEAMRARVESAAEARRIATLALEARNRGKVVDEGGDQALRGDCGAGRGVLGLDRASPVALRCRRPAGRSGGG